MKLIKTRNTVLLNNLVGVVSVSNFFRMSLGLGPSSWFEMPTLGGPPLPLDMVPLQPIRISNFCDEIVLKKLEIQV